MLISGIEKQVLVTNILDDISVMIWIKDRNNNLLYINNYVEKLLFNGKIGDITREKCPLSCKMSEVSTTKVNVLESVVIDGKELWLDCKKVPIDGGGTIIFAEDVTQKILNERKVMKVLDDKIDGWKKKREEKIKVNKNSIDKMTKSLEELKQRQQSKIYEQKKEMNG